MSKLERKVKKRKAKKAAYIRRETWAGLVRIVDKYISGRYGSKDQHRIRVMPTAEKVKRWQDKRAERKVFCLIQENFHVDDLWMTFTYPARTRKPPEDVKKDIKKFKGKVKRIYKKHGVELCYIGIASIGSKGGIHVHILFNNAFPEAAALIEKAWQDTVGTEERPYPMVNTKHLNRSGVWDNLAAYIIKNGVEARETGTPIYKHRYFYSRNLRMPEPEVKVVNADEWKEDPPIPKGYELVPGSLREIFGVNGYPYQTYTLVWVGDPEKVPKGGGKHAGRTAGRRVSPRPSRKKQNHEKCPLPSKGRETGNPRGKRLGKSKTKLRNPQTDGSGKV